MLLRVGCEGIAPRGRSYNQIVFQNG